MTVFILLVLMTARQLPTILYDDQSSSDAMSFPTIIMAVTLNWSQPTQAREQPVPDSGEIMAQTELLTNLTRADALLHEDKIQEAMSMYLQLWRDIPSKAPGLSVLRYSALLSRLERAALRDERSAERLAELRDSVEPKGDRWTSHAVKEWISLNKALHDDARSVNWYLEQKRLGRSRAKLAQIEHELFSLFVRTYHWDHAGMILTDPGMLATLLLDNTDGERQGIDEQMAIQLRRIAWDQVAAIYISSRAAERTETAIVQAQIWKKDRGGEDILSVVNKAISVRRVDATYLKWLQEARGRGADVGSAEMILKEMLERPVLAPGAEPAHPEGEVKKSSPPVKR